MARTARPLPPYIIERWRGWRAGRFEDNRAWYARLAEVGQHPRAMIITCCDSRVDVGQIFGAEPGELFIVRNVANIAPPPDLDGGRHGTSAAIEFAVLKLKISHLIVLGHSQCGGAGACFEACCAGEGHVDETDFIGKWLQVLRPAYDRLLTREAAEGAAETHEARTAAFEKEGVLESLSNLERYDFVQAAVEAGRLTLHGAWIDIAEGALQAYDPERDAFLPTPRSA